MTAILLCAMAAPAAAQDASQPAISGEIELNSGFVPDPYRVNVNAGGNINAINVANGCNGSISNAPDFQLTYRAGSLPLHIRVRSSADTTLVINDAQGRWVCDDDSGEGLNPSVTFDNPPTGVYDIWVGNLSGGLAPAQLEISELPEGQTASATQRPRININPGGTPVYGSTRLQTGFTPDPLRVPVQAGGWEDASQISSECNGRITREPDYRISYTAGTTFPLIFRTLSSSDTTLVVNDPGGHWHCDDDSGTDLNAEITFQRPQSGVYDIWVGSYDGAFHPAELHISELVAR